MTERRDRPNIVLMHCHDLGRFLGCYGNPTVHTPHLDSLAAQGVRFTNAFATAPQCSPSRASLFTGRWPHVNGVMGLTHGDFGWDLGAGERHLADHLQTAGYHTALLGVQHESRVRPDDELARRLGFDYADTTQVLADQVAANTIAHVDQIARSDQPFYLQVGFFEPHRTRGAAGPIGMLGFIGDHIHPDSSQGIAVPPYLIDTELARGEIAELQGAVRHMDAAAGRVLRHIRDVGVEATTMVLFTTDHGPALPRAKCTLYDPGLEVALIARYPARGWAGGQVHDEMVSNLDIVPTLLDTLGLTADDTLHGRSLVPLLDNARAVDHRQEVFGEITYHDYYDPRRCIRTHRYSSSPTSAPPQPSWIPASRGTGAALPWSTYPRRHIGRSSSTTSTPIRTSWSTSRMIPSAPTSAPD